MILAVLASDQQKKEIATSSFFQKHEVVFSENISLWAHHAADAYLDLSFEFSEERIAFLSRLLPKIVIVNSVVDTLDKLHADFIRVNAWPGFLTGENLEAAAHSETQERAIAMFGESMVFVKDEPGLVMPRIVSMIINEAYFALDAGISTKEEIDIAMKLGTSYPFGPFEWAEMIGEARIVELLKKLAADNPIYNVAPGLLKCGELYNIQNEKRER